MAAGCVVAGCAAASEHEEAGRGCASVDEDNGAMTAEDDESCGRTMLLSDFVAAAAGAIVAEDDCAIGGSMAGCATMTEDDEAACLATVLFASFLVAARASLSLLLQVEHVLRGDHSPFLSCS